MPAAYLRLLPERMIPTLSHIRDCKSGRLSGGALGNTSLSGRKQEIAWSPFFLPRRGRAVISVLCTILLLKTTDSSREFDASLLAPWTPVQAVSPAANNPGIFVSPQLLTFTPPI